jgi:hypothetical protein
MWFVTAVYVVLRMAAPCNLVRGDVDVASDSGLLIIIIIIIITITISMSGLCCSETST